MPLGQEVRLAVPRGGRPRVPLPKVPWREARAARAVAPEPADLRPALQGPRQLGAAGRPAGAVPRPTASQDHAGGQEGAGARPLQGLAGRRAHGGVNIFRLFV